ncbi:MAG: S8 family serine peptidase [Bacteroidota bacterium]
MAIMDWGFDFTHPLFIKEDGSSKFKAIWDQGAEFDGENPYGYGRVITQEILNSALRASEPFRHASYHPDPLGHHRNGTHGTHVAGILSRIAPQFDIIAVHLSTGKLPQQYSLGDSSRIIEGLDFIMKQKGERPCAINMSLGSMGGSHTGKSLVEQSIDSLLKSHKGVAICQSAGNYYNSKTHAEGYVTKNKSTSLGWIVDEADITPNELEIWYEGEDELAIKLYHNDSDTYAECIFNQKGEEFGIEHKIPVNSIREQIVVKDLGVVGQIYHRKNEPNTGKNHINIILPL